MLVSKVAIASRRVDSNIPSTNMDMTKKRIDVTISISKIAIASKDQMQI